MYHTQSTTDRETTGFPAIAVAQAGTALTAPAADAAPTDGRAEGRSPAASETVGGERLSERACYISQNRTLNGDAATCDAPDTVESAVDLLFQFPDASEVSDAGIAAAYLLGGDPQMRRADPLTEGRKKSSDDSGLSRAALTGSGSITFDRFAGALGVIHDVSATPFMSDPLRSGEFAGQRVVLGTTMGRRGPSGLLRDRFAGAVGRDAATSAESLEFGLRIASGAVTLSARSPERAAATVERASLRGVGDSTVSAAAADLLHKFVTGGPAATIGASDPAVKLLPIRCARCDRDLCGLQPGVVKRPSFPPLGGRRVVDGADRSAADWLLSIGDSAARGLMRAASSQAGAVHLADRGASTREVTEWSRKSRTNLVRAFAELDYAPILRAEGMPVMVTLTYPGCWLRVAPTGRDAKKHFKAFKSRFARRYGPLRAIWKLEFQGRAEGCQCTAIEDYSGCAGRDDGRAPHFHLWLARPTTRIVRVRGQKPGETPETPGGFAAWLSAAWAEIVDHPDSEQRRRHGLAGTAIDAAEGLRACDPKRLAIYFSKHAAAQSDSETSGKEYQHLVPEAWTGAGDGPGRFWGYVGLERAAVSVTLSTGDFVRARRIVRRWSRSRASYPAGAKYPSAVFPDLAVRRVRRGTYRDGRTLPNGLPAPRYRRSSSRRALMSHGTLTGGFVCVNAGPDFGVQLARAVADWRASLAVEAATRCPRACP